MYSAPSTIFRTRADPTRRDYRAEPQGLTPPIDWMGLCGAFWRGRFDALENLLNRMDQ
jgi:hypothetical protein